MTGFTGFWATLPHLTRAHFIQTSPNNKPKIASYCGMARTSEKHGWEATGSKPQCERCLAALEKHGHHDDLENIPDYASEISMYLSVSEEFTPVAWVPVPDLETLVVLLKAQRPEKDDPCVVVNNIREGIILALEKYIAEALERSKEAHKPTTWTYTGKEEE